MEGNYNFNNEWRVDSCVLEASTDISSHLGESFPFYCDSGAERSLIKESAETKLMKPLQTRSSLMKLTLMYMVIIKVD